MNKKIAIINSHAPCSSVNGKDALDVALIYGSYEQNISLFFQGEGVRQLMESQDLSVISLKNYLKTFSAFEFYDIEQIYVCADSLSERGLSTDFHIENVNVLSRQDFGRELNLHAHILRF